MGTNGYNIGEAHGSIKVGRTGNMEFKALPVGVDDFGKLIQKDYYYVDKTLFVNFRFPIGQIPAPIKLLRLWLMRQAIKVKKELEALMSGEVLEKPVMEDITYDCIFSSEDSLRNFFVFYRISKAGIKKDGEQKPSVVAGYTK